MASVTRDYQWVWCNITRKEHAHVHMTGHELEWESLKNVCKIRVEHTPWPLIAVGLTHMNFVLISNHSALLRLVPDC